MSNKHEKEHDELLSDALMKIPFPLKDKRHGFSIYLSDRRASSNETRIKHIINKRHDLKVRDIESIPNGINDYWHYKKDSTYKDTFNYYLKRKGEDKGYIKVSVQLDWKNKKVAWIKTIYITYKVK